MTRKSGVFLAVICLVFAIFSVAFAADAAQTQSGAKAGCAGCAKGSGGCSGCAQAKAGEAPAAPETASACPKCGMAGGLCAGCLEQEKTLLSQMAGDMCPNCEPGALCKTCQAAVDGALAALPTLSVSTVQSEPMRVAYTAGKVSDNMEQLITNTMTEAVKQGLMGKDMYVGCMYPDIMEKGYHPDSAVYACLSLPEDVQVKAPLQVYEIPAGSYLQVDHKGDYAKLGETWLAAFAYADLHGLQFGQGPAGEVYMSDPSTAPMDQWLTEIYIPLASDGATAPITPSVPSRPSA
jgi:effector-binding domain-containing protein